MKQSRALIALTASVSLMTSGCCLVQIRKDTGEPYVLPVRQWSWLEWGCVIFIGCIAGYISAHHDSDTEMSAPDPGAPFGEQSAIFPVR